MDIKRGEIFQKTTDGADFAVKKIVRDMVVLESRDGKRQILTEASTLALKSFYLKRIEEGS